MLRRRLPAGIGPRATSPAIRILGLAALLAAAGCGAQDRLPPGEPHADLSCGACHRGGRADFGRATVPSSACLACHEDGGLARVRLATVAFQHRAHGQESGIAVSCAGCHTHDRGDEPLRASVDACALCHSADIRAETQNCARCHAQPAHIQLTAQGVPVPHAALPIVSMGCTRCHYDVAEPHTAVDPASCADCHRRTDAATAAGIAEDLHPAHTGLTCTACHASGTHHIRAMSSAVALVCQECHRSAHELDLRAAAPSAALCADCHHGVHAPQQKLVLGLVSGAPAVPAAKFLRGLSCRSCHIDADRVAGAAGGAAAAVREGSGAPGVGAPRAGAPGAGAPGAGAQGSGAPGSGAPGAGAPGVMRPRGVAPPAPTAGEAPIRGTAGSCAGCHPPQYGPVLDRWRAGAETRHARAAAYLRQARRALDAGPDNGAVRELLDEAAALLDAVQAAGGYHNVEMSDRLFRESVGRAIEAYRLAGRTAPAPPYLGTPPHIGYCSYCHFDPNERLELRRMPAGVHEEMVQRLESARR